jgi:hypothetical protein
VAEIEGERAQEREEIGATFISTEVRRIRQGINRIEEEGITRLGRAPRREIWLEVRGDDEARHVGSTCQWKGEKREGTGSVLIAGLRAGFIVGPKGMPRGPLLFFFFFSSFFFSVS